MNQSVSVENCIQSRGDVRLDAELLPKPFFVSGESGYIVVSTIIPSDEFLPRTSRLAHLSFHGALDQYNLWYGGRSVSSLFDDEILKKACERIPPEYTLEYLTVDDHR